MNRGYPDFGIASFSFYLRLIFSFRGCGEGGFVSFSVGGAFLDALKLTVSI